MIAEPILPKIHSDKAPAEFFGYGVFLYKFKQGRFFVVKKGRILFTAKTRASATKWIYSDLKPAEKTASYGKALNQTAAPGKTMRLEKKQPTLKGFWQRLLERLFLPLYFIFKFFKNRP